MRKKYKFLICFSLVPASLLWSIFVLFLLIGLTLSHSSWKFEIVDLVILLGTLSLIELWRLVLYSGSLSSIILYEKITASILGVFCIIWLSFLIVGMRDFDAALFYFLIFIGPIISGLLCIVEMWGVWKYTKNFSIKPLRRNSK